MDFRLKVFQSVAHHQSFTRAAKELKISQPAISKHIQELESLYRIQLFERYGTKIKISAAGELLLSHTERILDAFQWLEYDMNQLTNRIAGELRIGASSTLAQYILPPLLALFIKKFPDVKVSLINGNSHQIETALLKKKIDLGMIEGISQQTEFHYTPFLRDEIVAVCSTKGTIKEYDEITLKQLKQLPIVLRENGSGTLDVLESEFKKHRIRLQDLNIAMKLGSTESIKLFLENSDCLGFISVRAIAPEIAAGRFKIIDISDFAIYRTFQFIQKQGTSGGIPEDFIRFAKRQIHI
ncbi:MAG: LysR substrate-binding domain-containing protein [Bacteroidales bacterium]